LGRVYFAARLALKQLNADGCVIRAKCQNEVSMVFHKCYATLSDCCAIMFNLPH
jgi:hypothetical protein